MNKMLYRMVLPGFFLLSSVQAYADNPLDPNTQSAMSDLTQYVKTLGEYMGYDLTNYCPQTGGPCNTEQGAPGSGSFSNLLINSASASGNQLNLMTSVIGALLPSLSSSSGDNQQSYLMIPNTGGNLSAYSNLFTQFGNKAFTQFSTPSSSGVSVSNLINQAPYQNDPVSQAVMDIISTPDASFCVNPGKGYFVPCYTGESNSSKNGGGPVISQNQVMMNVIGDPPPATGFFPLPTNNAQIVPQLSSDSLLGPLMFSTSSQGNNASSDNNSGSNSGLTAANQVQQAANYIRYATGSVSPMTLPNRTEYDNLYATAINASGNITLDEQAQAKTTLATYLTSLRVYAAQTSVGISNLYYILSKRMPQNSASGSGDQTSQALSEFTMATWRLYSPSNPSDKNQNSQQWLAQINQASTATVQKEIAILLAEMNYQLYLSRQQQERILLTNTMLLIQNTKAGQPSPNIGTSALNSGNGSATDNSDSTE